MVMYTVYLYVLSVQRLYSRLANPPEVLIRMRENAQCRLNTRGVGQQVEYEDEILPLLLAEYGLLRRHLFDLFEHVGHKATTHEPEQRANAATVAQRLYTVRVDNLKKSI
jgi:hypothetical protein